MPDPAVQAEGQVAAKQIAQVSQTLKRKRIPATLFVALLSAAVYAASYTYEMGVASALGYPSWLIEVGTTSVIRMAFAFMLLITVLSSLLYALLVLSSVIPRRAATILLYNRTAVILLLAISFPFAYLLLARKHPFAGWPLARAATVTFVVLFPLVALLYVARIIYYMRQPPSGGSFLDRLEQANARMAEMHGFQDAVPDSVGRRMAEHPVAGQFIAVVLLVGIIATALVLIPYAVGTTEARGQIGWYVCGDMPRLVALRRFGDYIVVAPMADSGTRLGPGIALVPVNDSSRIWTETRLGTISHLRADDIP